MILHSLPRFCICKGKRLMKVRLIGQHTWFTVPCPHCAHSLPLLELVAPR